MVDVEDTMSSLVHDLGCLLLGGESFNGYFARNEGNEISNRVQLQEDIYGQCKFVKGILLLPHSVGDRLKF